MQRLYNNSAGIHKGAGQQLSYKPSVMDKYRRFAVTSTDSFPVILSGNLRLAMVGQAKKD
jgi:hypothetical protein